MAGIEAFLILAVATLHLAVVARRVGPDQLVTDAQLGGSFLEQCGQIALAVGETVGKLETVVRLDTLHFYASAGVPRPQPAQEVRRGIGGLLRVGRQETQPRELIDGGVLEQAQLRVRNTAAGNDLDIHLHTLAGIGHLLVRLRFVRIFGLFGRKQPHFAHDAEQALRTAGVAALPQTVPQLDHAQRRIAAAHIADELQLDLCVLVGVAVRASGLAGQGRHTPVPALLPEVDVRPAFVVFPAGAADAVLFCVLH